MGSDVAEHQPTHRLVPRREKPVADDLLDIFGQGTEPVPPADPPEAMPVPARKPTIQEKADAFHKAHPEVLEEFVRLTRIARRNGHKRVGGKMLAELVRWHFIVDREYDADNEHTYTINNVIVSRLVRRLQAEHPDLADMFETRKLLSK